MVQEVGKKRERDPDDSPARRLWLAFSRRSSPPLQAEWGNNQMVATTNHLGQLKNPLRFEPKAKAGVNEVTERKRKRGGRKAERCLLQRSGRALQQFRFRPRGPGTGTCKSEQVAVAVSGCGGVNLPQGKCFIPTFSPNNFTP